MKRELIFLGDDLGGGGAERAMVEIIRWLRRARPEIPLGLLLLKRRGPLLDEIPADVPIAELGGGGPFALRNAVRLFGLARHLRRHPGATVVAFMHHMNQLALLAGRAAPAVRVIGVEQCAVGVSHATGTARQVGRRERRRLAWLYRRATRLIVSSTGIQAELESLLGPSIGDRCVVIPNPVDPVVHSEPPSTPPVGFRFLFAGRLVPQKNLRLLLEAFAVVRRHLPDEALVLRIVGDGPCRGELESLSRELGIAPDLEWTGFQRPPWPALAAGDTLLLPSNFEGFGNVLAEALALGLPVVATDCPHGPRDIVRPDARLGLLTPVGDRDALVEAMTRMVKDRAWWRAAAAFRREHARRYSIDAIGPRYESVLLP